jgi:hypothetical protein
MVMSAEFKEIEVEGAVYRYITFRHGDYDKGVTQHIEVYKGEDSIGGKDDPATYGEPHRNPHPAQTMEGVARIFAREIIDEHLRRTK